MFYLQKGSTLVSTSSLAERLEIKDASVTSMIKKLSDSEFIDYTSHKGIKLTKKGKDIALRIIRKHRLLEIYLNESLKLEADKVHKEAEKLEHYVSDELMQNIENVLGNRLYGVHGEEIPVLN